MRWVLYPIAALFALAILGIATLAAMAFFAWPNLPALDTLTDYRPRVPLQYIRPMATSSASSARSAVTWFASRSFPPTSNAILAAETSASTNTAASIRSAWRAPRSPTCRPAAAARAPRRSPCRSRGISSSPARRPTTAKLYEILLALKIEQNLGKDQILELYINQIFLGQRAYGFAAAARAYYGKTLDDLTCPGGDARRPPKAPSAFNPIVNPHAPRCASNTSAAACSKRASSTTRNTSDALAFATPKQSQRDIAAARRAQDIVVPGDHVAEMARQIAVEQFGEQAYELGIRIITTVTRNQEAAYAALRRGVLDYDRRHGYRGPEAFIELPAGQGPRRTTRRGARRDQRPRRPARRAGAQGRAEGGGRLSRARRSASPAGTVLRRADAGEKAPQAGGCGAGRSCACAIPPRTVGRSHNCRKCRPPWWQSTRKTAPCAP